MNCDICNKREHERSIQEQCGFYLCVSCSGSWSDEELKEVFSYVGAENNKTNGSRPSAGFLGILFFLKKCNCQSITLIGFDFFSKRLPIQTGEDYPASWHMPINSIKANPHNENEKVIVQEWANQELLKWVVISDLKDEFLELT